MFRELFDTAPDAMIVCDTDGNIVRVNGQAMTLFGFSEEELRGKPIEVLMPERVRHAHHTHMRDYSLAPRVRPMGSGQELVGQKRDGQQFPVEIALSPLNTPDGKLFLASVRDISATQRARQALVRARYDACVAQIGELLLVAPNMDSAIERIPSLIVQAMNVSGVAIMFKHLQLPQMQVRSMVGITAEPLDEFPWPSVFAKRASNTGEMAIVTSPVVAGFESSLIIPMFDHDEPMGALVAVTRPRMEFDRDALHFLQSVANLLTATMQRSRMEEQLSHAQRLEAVGQLTGGVAHDFNNLLTVISGNLQILEDELSDRPNAKEIIGTALRAVGRGADLTRKLLAFARRQRLSPRALDPHAMLNELGVMLRRTLGETIQVSIGCAPRMAQVYSDPAQLDAALVNLALNARDAMPRGGQLSITAAEQQVTPEEVISDIKPGPYVVFEVRDTGLGMSPDVLARAFEPFFTTKEQGKGSGLGLSMVYGFVKQSGGHLSVESQLGYGTSIRLFLPAVHTAKVENEPTSRPASRGNETILVVEDENDVRNIAVSFLRSFGYSVVSAPDAQTALDKLELHPEVALLFSDVVLGEGMTGAELAVEVRRLHPRMPVLLTSGYEHTANAETGTLSQFELLPKPYRRDELSRAVRQILDAG